MTPEFFANYWEKRYPKCPPVGYLLREAFPEIWFRIHPLPNSKRYAQTMAEEDEILNRHNLILNELLRKGDDFVMISTEYSIEPMPIWIQYYSEIIEGDVRYFMSYPMHSLVEDDDDDPNYWHFFVTEKKWRSESLNIILELCSNEKITD